MSFNRKHAPIAIKLLLHPKKILERVISILGNQSINHKTREVLILQANKSYALVFCTPENQDIDVKVSMTPKYQILNI